ncbi:MAG TPA: hypothetical protein VF406_10830 [Thermodesulfobacteriota bacterium]
MSVRDDPARNRALIEARRLEVGARVRHLVGPPRVYIVTGYTEGAKVRVRLEDDPGLRGAFSPRFLERVDRG